jgi:hypothetical protein
MASTSTKTTLAARADILAEGNSRAQGAEQSGLLHSGVETDVDEVKTVTESAAPWLGARERSASRHITAAGAVALLRELLSSHFLLPCRQSFAASR